MSTVDMMVNIFECMGYLYMVICVWVIYSCTSHAVVLVFSLP